MSPEPPLQEPSVLDYLKSRLAFWQPGPRLELPALPAPLTGAEAAEEEGAAEDAPRPVWVRPAPAPRPPRPKLQAPALALAAIALALAAQFALEPRPDRAWRGGALLYLAALVATVLAQRNQELALPDLEEGGGSPPAGSVRLVPLLLALLTGALAMVMLGGGLFTQVNLAVWAVSLGCLLLAFWQFRAPFRLEQLKAALARPAWSLQLNWRLLSLAGVAVIAVYFLFNQAAGVPAEMISEHAEKLQDVSSVLHGQTQTGFPRSTGNEALQTYLTAAVAQIFHTGVSFLSLKAAMLLCALLTLPFIYLLGEELASPRAGLLAMAFAGVSYWPNVVARSGLTFSLYPFFFAPAFYFFLRGLRSAGEPGDESIFSGRNAFLLSGLFTGLGLNGYSAFQVVPFLLAFGLLLFLLHRPSRAALEPALLGFGVLALAAFFVCLPLLRFSLDNRDSVVFLSLFRYGVSLPALTENPLLLFARNLWAALSMFAWDNGDQWVVSVAHRPALDVVSGALFHLGLLLALLRYLRRRRWQDLMLLLAIPILMLPSVLSLAYPAENPALNRAAGALVPVFVLVGLAADSLMSAFEKKMSPAGTWAALALAGALFGVSALQNHALVFSQYAQAYDLSSWNTSEIGGVVRSFAELNGGPETAYLVAYPYWVDSRLVMINAGYPDQDNAILSNRIPTTVTNARPKLFILNPQDQPNLDSLKILYPQGWLQVFKSKTPVKDFFLYFVPATPASSNPAETTP